MVEAASHAATGERSRERADTKPGGPFNSWGDVDNAFKARAKQFAKKLGELDACPTTHDVVTDLSWTKP